MRLSRQVLPRFIRAIAFIICSIASASAQSSYPSRPIKFIVPYAAGGLPDTVARIVAHRLQERLSQPIVVEKSPARVAVSGLPR
jgi:tripartite-type tricarboxylate transporter receptor subunit TctC